jgi:V8-like Glu-specific endopeptidase
VLVRLAPTGIQVKPVKVARLAELATTDEEKAGNHNAPTLLQSVSYFPLAKYALPKKFETGYVVPQMEVCAAVSKTDACFSHICSAVPGGSGSPIFASDAQGIVLVGTHIGGGATEISQDCKAPPGVQTNSAAIVNTSRAPQFFAASAQSPGG